MPTVPNYSQFQEVERPLPAVRQESIASPDLLDAGARQAEAAGVETQRQATIMSGIVGDMLQEKYQTQAKAGDTNFTLLANDLQHNPNSGYMTLQGKNAIDAYPATAAAIKQTAQKSIDNIESEPARVIAAPIINARAAAALDSVSKHAVAQTRIYQVQTSEARAMASLQDGANDYTNEVSFLRGLGTAVEEAESQGKLRGWDRAMTDLQAQKYTDTAFKLRYDAWRTEDPAGAFTNFLEHRREISPLARVQIGHQLFEAAAPALAIQLNAEGGAGIVAPAPAAAGKGGIAGSEPRGVRNNNPGNVMKSEKSWQGEVQGNDPRYASFETPEAGIRAMARTLINYQDLHGLNTVEGIVARWAPATENNTVAYIATVSNALGVNPGEPMDLHDQKTLAKLTKAMIQVENGKMPYSDQQIALGLAAASGGALPKSVTPNPTIGTAYRDPAIPTGNAIVDVLPSNWKLHVLQLARGQAAQAMAAAREQLKTKVQDASEAYMVNGSAPNSPGEAEFIQAYGQGEGVARYRSFQDVARLGQQIQQVKTLPFTAIKQMLEQAKPMPGDGFAERQHNYEILTRAADQVQKARQKDPVAYAITMGTYGIQPFENFNDPGKMTRQLAARASAAPRIATDYGTATALFTDGEVRGLSAALKAAPVETQKSYLATMYQGIGDLDMFKQAMQAIAPDAPTVAVAGIYQAKGRRTPQNQDVAELILRGQAILTPNKKTDGSGHQGGQSLIKMPEASLMLSEWNANTGDAFKGKEQAADLFQQTAKAIYAAKSAEEGDYSGTINTKRWKQAISLATGGIAEHNGSKIVLPYGVQIDEFRDALKARVETLPKEAQPIAATPRDLLRLPLENIGDSLYLFRRGAGYVVTKDGQPLTVNLNNSGRVSVGRIR